MDRRLFLDCFFKASALTLGAGGTSFFTNVAAQTSGLETNKIPLAHVNVPEDVYKTIFFFDFSCNYSGAYHIPMLNWAKTAPAPIKTEFIPVINPADYRRREEMAIAAQGYYAGVACCKSAAQLEKFVTEIYNNRQLQGMPLRSSTLWQTSVRNAGISKDSFMRANQAITLKTLQNTLKKFKQYSVAATPTVAVAGQYTLNPDQANGDPELFFNIVNGLASNFILS
jgi:hypothetical protein